MRNNILVHVLLDFHTSTCFSLFLLSRMSSSCFVLQSICNSNDKWAYSGPVSSWIQKAIRLPFCDKKQTPCVFLQLAICSPLLMLLLLPQTLGRTVTRQQYWGCSISMWRMTRQCDMLHASPHLCPRSLVWVQQSNHHSTSSFCTIASMDLLISICCFFFFLQGFQLYILLYPL